MKYIKLYDNRHDFVFDEQRYFPNTALVNGEDEPSYFTDVEEVVFELTVTLPTEKVVTGQTYTLAVQYGGADVFSEATVTSTGDVTISGSSFTANTDGDFTVTAVFDGKTTTLNGTSKLMTATPTITKYGVSACGIHLIDIVGNGTKSITVDDVEYTSTVSTFRKPLYEGDTAHDTVITATAQETGKWESAAVTATFSIPAAQTFTASLSDTTLEDGQTTQLTVMYGSDDVSSSSSVVTSASGDLYVNVAPTFIAYYSTGSGSLEVSSTNPNLTPITINVTVAEPSPNIVFADNDVKTILAGAYGSNGEITEAQAAAVTTFMSGNDSSTNGFYDSSAINSFSEFSYFTGISSVGNYTFYGCFNMASVNIPANVTSIGDSAFRSCSSLTSITIPNGVTAIGADAFRSCSGLTGISLGNSLTSIGNRAFQYCSNLTSVTIPNSVTMIGIDSFYGCSAMTSLTISSSVRNIGLGAFVGCTALTSITCEATTPPSKTGLGTFDAFNNTNNCPIYVPAASVDAYKASSDWSPYASRIQAIGVTVSLSSENIETGETYTLSVKYNGVDVLSNATVTSTGDVTISGSSFTANSDGAFSITATYNGYTATLNGTASTPVPEPEYAVAVLDCSDLEDANPLEECANYDTEAEEFPEGVNTIECSFSGNVYVENGVITIPTDGNFASFNVNVNPPDDGYIVYVKLTHPSAEYKLNADTTVLNEDFFTCDVSFDSTTLTTTIDNVVPLDNMQFDGSSLELYNGGSTPIKITQIEVGFVPPAEEEE